MLVQVTMSKRAHHISFVRASTSSMPSLAPIVTQDPMLEPVSKEREWFCLSSVLAQIEIASCFRSDAEPLFKLLSPILYAIPNL